MKIDQLKEQARRHEQQEAWSKALDSYLQAIEITEASDEPDISLFNRVGDLQVRVGDVDGAVATYERAIDLYMESDLPNNAIAICQKIIRNVPGRAAAYLKMGQVRARQGFVVDARQNFLTYAEMKQSKGETDEAFRALEEFVALAPADVETRLFLAEQFAAKGDLEKAVAHFDMAHRYLLKEGADDRAAQLRERVSELSPDATLSAEPLPDEDEAEPLQGGLVGFETTTMGEFGLDDPEEEPSVVEADVADSDGDQFGEEPADDELGFADISSGADEGGEEEPEVSEALEGAAEESGFGDFDLPGFDQESALEEEDDEDAAEEAEPLPTIDLEGADGDEGDEAGEDEAEPLPSLDLDAPSSDGEEDAPIGGAGEEFEGVEFADLGDGDEVEEEAGGATDDFGDLDFGEATEAVEEAAQEAAAEPEPAADEPPPADEPAPDAPPAGGTGDDDDFVDLGSMVLEDKKESTTRWKVQTDGPSGDEAADFAKMLSQFKEKVAENLDTGDFTARYDLGAAYKEMGLLEEAISEFQAALRADPKSLAALEMLGQCFLEKGEAQAAIKTLQRALAIPNEVEDDFLGIYYYLGQCYEATGDEAQALEVYEKVFSLDINFKDVTERLRALR